MSDELIRKSKAFCIDYNAIIIGNIHDNPELLKGE